MANPTTNFGWVMPTSASLVTNLPADFNTFGQAVDTSMAQLKGGTTGQILSKTSATDMAFTWITNDVGDITAVTAGTGISGGGTSGAVTITNDMATTITASGDIVVGTGSSTYDNLPIGTTGQVLTADTTVSPYKVKWATPSAGGTANWSLLNTGGTTLTGAATITVSGISGANQVMIVFVSASTTASSTIIGIRINTDTTTKYNTYGTYVYSPASYVTGGISQNITQTGATYIQIGDGSGVETSAASGYCLISGANATGIKTFQAVGGFSRSGNDSQANNIVGGVYTGTSTISSVSMYSPTANFDAGTVYVYTTA